MGESTVRAPTLRGQDPNTRKPRFTMPRGSCDCHAHVFGPQSRFPYLPDASYIPPDASPEDYARMLRTIGCERAALVQPSVYGSDNSAMIAAMRSGVFPFRGVAVVSEDITDRELRELHDAGVRAVRINLASDTPGLTLEQAKWPRSPARSSLLRPIASSGAPTGRIPARASTCRTTAISRTCCSIGLPTRNSGRKCS